MRRSAVLSAFLDGVVVASLALMGGVTYQLADAALEDWFTWVALGVAVLLVFRTRVNSAWLVAGGGVAGMLYRLAT
jgi:chromate transporter